MSPADAVASAPSPEATVPQQPAAPATAAAPEPQPAAETAAPAPVVYDFKNADGTPVEPEYAKELTALATEYKLSAEQATKLQARDASRIAAREDALVKQWEAAAADAEKRGRADPVLGPQFDEHVAHAKLMSDKYSPKGVSIFALAERLGVHKDPDFLHFMRAIYEGQKEPSSVVGGSPVGVAPRLYPNSPSMYAGKES